ncbi:hypothetical protein C2G38_2198618 [Gigaspora rosea]|uniref:Uncharacterized protein n=1 Tax=Gigaspora rosea TaxID=44941 RepID=A0A397USG3_9GLOM|nr:hypothetical protein C2G38_2198618 [Gigaspora rosea]
MYTLEDLDNSLREAYYLTERYRKAIIDLTNLLNIEQNNKFALRYQEEAYYITVRELTFIT